MQVWQASQDLQPMFAGIDQLIGQNLRRVQAAMQRHRIGPHHFSGSTGYGHGDLGREAYDEVYSSRQLHACYALTVSSSPSSTLSDLETVTAKYMSQKSGKNGHCVCNFASCVSPLTKQYPSCHTCNTMSVCMNASTAHSLKLFHGTYAQAAESCCGL